MLQNSRKPRNPRNRSRQPSNYSGSGKVFESNGPDIKIRGSAEHIVEKYITLARELQGSGDRVVAESYMQFAEHYQRIVSINQESDKANNIEKNDKTNSANTKLNEPIRSHRDKDIAVKSKNIDLQNSSHNNVKKDDLKDNKLNDDVKNDIPNLNLQTINVTKEVKSTQSNLLNEQES